MYLLNFANRYLRVSVFYRRSSQGTSGQRSSRRAFEKNGTPYIGTGQGLPSYTYAGSSRPSRHWSETGTEKEAFDTYVERNFPGNGKVHSGSAVQARRFPLGSIEWEIQSMGAAPSSVASSLHGSNQFSALNADDPNKRDSASCGVARNFYTFIYFISCSR